MAHSSIMVIYLPTVKHLGVLFCSNLSWSDHCHYVLAKVSKSLNLLHHTLWSAIAEAKFMAYMQVPYTFTSWVHMCHVEPSYCTQTRPYWNQVNDMQHLGREWLTGLLCRINWVNLQVFSYKSKIGLLFHHVMKPLVHLWCMTPYMVSTILTNFWLLLFQCILYSGTLYFLCSTILNNQFLYSFC